MNINSGYTCVCIYIYILLVKFVFPGLALEIQKIRYKKQIKRKVKEQIKHPAM